MTFLDVDAWQRLQELQEQRLELSEARAEAERLRGSAEELRGRLRSSERQRMGAEIAWRRLQNDLERQSQSHGKELTLEQLVKSLAALELRQVDLKGEERQQAKRKLMLRWHPETLALNCSISFNFPLLQL